MNTASQGNKNKQIYLVSTFLFETAEINLICVSCSATRDIWLWYFDDLFYFSVPQQGGLLITTEFGKMQVDPNEICVIQVCLKNII